MYLLLFFLASCFAMALWAQRRERDEAPRTRSVLILVAIVSIGYLARRMI